MSAPDQPIPRVPPEPSMSGGTTHIRGSWLLVAGRLANVVLDFAIQVMLVRYLTTDDYGALVYALSVVSLATTIAILGLDRAVGRFVPIYDEQRSPNLVFGSWVLASVSVVLMGAAITALVILVGGIAGDRFVSDAEALALLLILVVTTPLNALAAITRQMLATFASPRLILFRSYLLSPILQVALVAVVLLTGASVEVLAIGWVGTIVLSSAVSTVLVIRILRNRDLIRSGGGRLRLPVRALFGFGMPLFGSTLVVQLRLSGAVILLEQLHDTTAVALFRAAVPVARQTQLLFETFQLLFTPLAARLYARGALAELNDAYWRTALWISVFSFPAFALAFAFPEPLIALFFGDRYLPMAPALALLAVGFYLNAALGFNALLLRIMGRVRFTVTVDVATTLVGIAVAYPLIQAWSATGAAAAVTSTLVAQNVAYQLGLRRERGLRAADGRFTSVYVALLLGTAVLWLAGATIHPGLLPAVALTGIVSLAIFLVSRASLQIGEIFPELRRVRLARWLVGS
jgi:O-antigen/teichoic acid export membrane protein